METYILYITGKQTKQASPKRLFVKHTAGAKYPIRIVGEIQASSATAAWNKYEKNNEKRRRTGKKRK